MATGVPSLQKGDGFARLSSSRSDDDVNNCRDGDRGECSREEWQRHTYDLSLTVDPLGTDNSSHTTWRIALGAPSGTFTNVDSAFGSVTATLVEGSTDTHPFANISGATSAHEDCVIATPTASGGVPITSCVFYHATRPCEAVSDMLEPLLASAAPPRPSAPPPHLFCDLRHLCHGARAPP
ncbi:hypothetical protein LXA43DRAFT_1063383 [Ganoderma leucocontextum]|nr:hypothetical protein LXA43DRAFT_1063383 [Ganoderma leucocontextum]